MKRRAFITLLGGAATTWPLTARTQQLATPVIGYLSPGSAESDAFRVAAFRQGLNEFGYIEGRNVTIEYRWAENHYDRMPALVADLVRRRMAVIAATTTPAAVAARAAITTIPIVFETNGDPIKLGLVANLNRPGDNITGVTQLGEEVLPKRFELLHELLPTARVMALLVNPANPALAEPQVRVALSAAETFGLELHVLNASTESDFNAVFPKLTELRAGGLVIGGDALFTDHNDQLAALTVQHAMPAIYQRRAFAAAGGLLSYGGDIAYSYRLAGDYVARILKGEKPADLPVQQATKVELYVNLKTAKGLGLTIPITLLGRADEVIE
jgi:putative ABC transport system substrate-binding protein